MKHLFNFLAISIISAGLVSFKKNDPVISNTNVTFKADLKTGTDLSGTATLTFNTTTKIFTLTVLYTGPKAISVHIQNGAHESCIPIIFPSTYDLTSPITYVSDALDPAQEKALNANLCYINLKSTAYPDGEIRGLLIRQETEGGSPPPPPGY